MAIHRRAVPARRWTRKALSTLPLRSRFYVPHKPRRWQRAAPQNKRPPAHAGGPGVAYRDLLVFVALVLEEHAGVAEGRGDEGRGQLDFTDLARAAAALVGVALVQRRQD